MLRSTSRTQGLILLETDDLASEQVFVDNLFKLEQTLNGTHVWGDSVADPTFVNLKPFFDGQVDWSVLLPDSYGNLYRDEPLLDPTFSGIFPSMTQTKARNTLIEAGLLTDNIWYGIEPLQLSLRRQYQVFQSQIYYETDWYAWWNNSEPGLWWKSHWFGTFYKQASWDFYDFDQRVFPSKWMFHLWLGLIYPAEATPESIWI